MARDAPINFMNPRRETASDPLRGALGEFAVHHLAKFVAAREFFQAAPELRPLGFLDAGTRGLQVKLVVLAGANLFAFF